MFNINLDPLVNKVKEFNQNQVRTNQLLAEILQQLKKHA